MSEKKREANLNFIPRSVITKGASKGKLILFIIFQPSSSVK